MENATKALLIAAAILIAILIISLSLVVYNMAAEQVGNADLTEAEAAVHNSKFKIYDGAKLTPDELLTLQRVIISHNQQEKEKGTENYVKLIYKSSGVEKINVDNTSPDVSYINWLKANGYETCSIVELKYKNGLVSEIFFLANKK